MTLPIRRAGSAAGALISVVVSTGCHSLLLWPTHHPVSTAAERLTVPGRCAPLDGAEIELFRLDVGPPHPVPDAYVLSIAGNAGRAEHMVDWTASLLAPWWEDTGRASKNDGEPLRLAIIALQHPGYGPNQRDPTLPKLARAGVEALEYLNAQRNGRPVFVHAWSLGTAVALHATRELGAPAVDGLILEKPPNLRSLILWRHGWWNLWLAAAPLALSLPESFLSDRNARAIDGVPALCIAADADRVVPAKSSRQVFDAYGGPKRWAVSFAGHNDPVNEHNTPDLAVGLDWLRRLSWSRDVTRRHSRARRNAPLSAPLPAPDRTGRRGASGSLGSGVVSVEGVSAGFPAAHVSRSEQ